MNVTVEERIEIAAPPEVVWDFTQDWTTRETWDSSVSSAEILSMDPLVVKVAQGGMRYVNRYKIAERPRRTSLAITEVTPAWVVVGGGGSWTYAETPSGGTNW